MKISSCNLALLSFLIFSIKTRNAFPCFNSSKIQSFGTTLRTILNYLYDPFTDTPVTWTTRKFLTYNPITDKPYSTRKSTPTPARVETLIYKPLREKRTTMARPKEILKYTYVPLVDKITTPPSPSQKYRNRYHFKHRFRNPIITITSAQLTTSLRVSQKWSPQSDKSAPYFKYEYNDMYSYKTMKEYAFIKTPLNSTPMVHLNITVPKMLLEGKVPRLASPYIIRITLARRLAPRSNTTLPNRGFLRIVGSKVNMFQEGNLAMILGKIASQIGNAYNMTGKDVQGMRHVIVVGPGGQMMNRRATPPKKTTVLTSPPVMTARVRLRLNCTLPKITDQVIYFEDYTKYFELY